MPLKNRSGRKDPRSVQKSMSLPEINRPRPRRGRNAAPPAAKNHSAGQAAPPEDTGDDPNKYRL